MTKVFLEQQHWVYWKLINHICVELGPGKLATILIAVQYTTPECNIPPLAGREGLVTELERWRMGLGLLLNYLSLRYTLLYTTVQYTTLLYSSLQYFRVQRYTKLVYTTLNYTLLVFVSVVLIHSV